MNSLNCMRKRRAIPLAKEIQAHFDHAVRTHADEVPVKSCVVERAERKSVAHHWVPLGVGIGKDVRRIQEFIVPKLAERTLPAVGVKHALAKCPLVKPDPGHCSRISATSLLLLVSSGGFADAIIVCEAAMASIVHGNRKSQSRPVVTHDEHRPGGDVFPLRDPMKIDEGQTLLHREPKSRVVPVIRVDAAVPVFQEAVRIELVLVGVPRGRENRKRCDRKNRGLEYPLLGAQQRDAGTLKLETLEEHVSRQDIADSIDEVLQPVEGRETNTGISRAIEHGFAIPSY